MYIPRSKYSNKSTRIENPSDINIYKDNLSVSGLFEQVEILSSETPDTICITRRNKRKKNAGTYVDRKQPIQELVNPKKRAKENTLTDLESSSPKERPPMFWHKVDYKGNIK